MRKHEITIRIILAILVGSGLTIGLSVMFITNSLVEKDQLQDIKQKESKIVLYADFLQNMITKKSYTIEQIAKQDAFVDFSSKEKNADSFGISENSDMQKRELLKNILYYDSGFSAIGLFFPNGDIYLSEPYSGQQNLQQENFAFRDWYKGITVTSKTYISEPYETQYSDEKTIAIASPIIRQDRLIGIIHATLDLEELQQVLENIPVANEARIFVVDQHGKVGLASQKIEYEIPFTDLISNFGKSDYIVTKINGQEMLVIQTPVEIGQNQWYVFYVQPYGIAFETSIATQNLTTVITAIILSVLAISGVIVYYAIKKNNVINQSLQKSNVHLKNFMSALDESSIVAMTDKQGNITYVNDKFCDISKYSRDELVGQNNRILKSGHHPSEFYDNMWKAITSGKVWQGDIKNRSKDGSYYWGKTTIIPFLGNDGTPEQFIAVKSDITNQKILEENLQKTLEEFKKTERLKEEFSTMVSHELKTPLTPIKGYCEMLMEPDIIGTLTPEQRDAIKEIERNAIRLERLIADILDAQKLDMEKMIFNREPFDVNLFLSELRADLLPLISEKKIRLDIKSSINGSINSDKQRLRQVIDNLIKNSVDFVPKDVGHIIIEVKNQNGDIVFSVEDNGIGIPKDAQKNIFKKFYQVDTSHTRKHGGTGLGLVVSKGIIEQLGGRIWFESEQGKGSIFYFSIPR